jgi:hypothetical protein
MIYLAYLAIGFLVQQLGKRQHWETWRIYALSICLGGLAGIIHGTRA